MLKLRPATRLVRSLGRVAEGLLTIERRFPALDAAGRSAEIGRWSRALLRDFGLEVAVDGQPPAPGPLLLLANHVSWLDIPVLHAVVPQARFISKAEIHGWPLLGRLVAGAGTLFIERERKRDALRVVHHVAGQLQAGSTVAFFPEGTTGPGPLLGPFHANLLEAAIATGTPLQFALIRYVEPGQAFSPRAAYVGDTTLLGSAWAVAGARGLRAQVRLLAPVAPEGSRRDLAQRLQQQAQQALDAWAAEPLAP